jgi:hypothetical protein
MKRRPGDWHELAQVVWSSLTKAFTSAMPRYEGAGDPETLTPQSDLVLSGWAIKIPLLCCLLSFWFGFYAGKAAGSSLVHFALPATVVGAYLVEKILLLIWGKSREPADSGQS